MCKQMDFLNEKYILELLDNLNQYGHEALFKKCQVSQSVVRWLGW